MEDIFTTAAESLPIEQIEQIEPSDLTVSNFKKILDAILPGVRSLAFNIVICILIYVIGSKVIALIKRMLTRALNRMQAESGLSHFLESAIDIVLHIFLIFMILGQLGVNTASIVTVLGTLMLAVGMSLQGSLSNVAGGILILLMHPFRVGHYIICDYGEGTVSAIGLVYTTLTTKDNRVLTIPNGQISNCAVTDCGENRPPMSSRTGRSQYLSTASLRALSIWACSAMSNPLLFLRPSGRSPSRSSSALTKRGSTFPLRPLSFICRRKKPPSDPIGHPALSML